MTDVGGRLRLARERHRISRDQISSATKISVAARERLIVVLILYLAFSKTS